MSRRWGVLAGACLLVATAALLPAGCAPRSAVPATTLTPLLRPDQRPTTSAATTTTVAPSSDPSDPLLAAVPEGECVYADPTTAGEVTFIAGDRLFGVAPDGTGARCLAELAANERGAVSWAPRGQRALLHSVSVFDADGKRQSGYLADNTRVRWVAPSGGALIAPTTSGRTLVRRDAASGARSEVTFLGLTDLAISHPAGGALIGAGTAPDGTRGVYVAGDTGADRRPVMQVDDPDTTLTDLAVDASGTSLYVVADQTTSFHVLRLSFPDLALADLTADQSPISALTGGPVPGTMAWRTGLCNSVTRVRVVDERVPDPVDVGEANPLDTLSLTPLGWLDVNRLVVAARPLGCDGPADVWIWSRLDNSATLLVKSVEFPAVRVVAQAATSLAISPGATPPRR